MKKGSYAFLRFLSKKEGNAMDLPAFFQQNPKTAIAFSGGVDSAYLLYAAKRWGKETCAYFARSAFQPEFEWEDARRLAEELEVPLRVIPLDILADEAVVANGEDRCYHCKKRIFAAIAQAAAADGYPVLLDGTNASDDEGDRPGMRALREMAVRSPLRECGITKEQVRQRSKEAGLFTWNKPAYACLATRIPTGQPITGEQLAATERAENYLFSLGFTDFRVRRLGRNAKLQFRQEQMEQVLAHREQILAALKADYDQVWLDLEARG